MLITKEILSFFSKKEPSTDLLFAILSTDTLYIDKLQKLAEEIAKEAEVTTNE